MANKRCDCKSLKGIFIYMKKLKMSLRKMKRGGGGRREMRRKKSRRGGGGGEVGGVYTHSDMAMPLNHFLITNPVSLQTNMATDLGTSLVGDLLPFCCLRKIA